MARPAAWSPPSSPYRPVLALTKTTSDAATPSPSPTSVAFPSGAITSCSPRSSHYPTSHEACAGHAVSADPGLQTPRGDELLAPAPPHRQPVHPRPTRPPPQVRAHPVGGR